MLQFLKSVLWLKYGYDTLKIVQIFVVVDIIVASSCCVHVIHSVNTKHWTSDYGRNIEHRCFGATIASTAK